MARGKTPRQPSKSGKQAGVRGPARSGKAQGLAVKGRGKTPPPPQNQTQKKAPQSTSAKGYDPLAPARITDILKGLDGLYPNVTCALHHKSAWELVVATILSAQCTDVRVNLVTPELFAKYPTPQHFAALEPEELEPDIRSTGFYRNNVVLGSWFAKPDGVVVDTHVHRISRRLELTTNDEPSKIEQDLMRVIPREKWILFAHQIIWHGRKICVARSPKCAECPLENLCHAGDKTWSTVEMHKGAQ